MALDPRTRLAQSGLSAKESTDALEVSCAKTDGPASHPQREETAKRKKMNALTEALLDPCTTMQEGELESLILAATQWRNIRTATRSK